MCQTINRKLNEKGMNIDWKNVDVVNRGKGRKQKKIKLVSDACGHAGKGLLAIMGPSGCGKTTLIRALAGMVPNGSSSTGIMTLNGVEREAKTWSNSVGFVDQKNAIYDELTAREAAMYVAKFRLEEKEADISEKIERLFKQLGITHILDCTMSSISVGERTRVMIAIELLTDPKVFFLDEPTRGLDSNTTIKIITLLKGLSEEGRTILFTIYQPDDAAVAEFDEILLLSRGRTVYVGKMVGCEKHLELHGFRKDGKQSFSGFLMKVLNAESNVYHETEGSSKLDALVDDVKEKFGFSQKEKCSKTSNDRYTNIVPNIHHIVLLSSRRYSSKLFALFDVMSMIVSACFTCLIIHCLRVSINSAIQKILGTGDTLKSLGTEFKYPPLIMVQCMFDKILMHFMFDASLYLGIFIAVISLRAGLAFSVDQKRAKREISVNMYSVSSYYFSVVLPDFLMSLVPFIFVMFITRLKVKEVFNMEVILTYFFMFSTTISTHFFLGSLLRGTKKVIVALIIFTLLNACPFYRGIVDLKLRSIISNRFIFTYLLNLTPNYLLCWCPYVGRLAKFVEDYSDMDDFVRILTNDEQFVDSIVRKVKEYKSLMVGIEVPLTYNYCFGGILMILYVVLCIATLAFRLRPETRMRLNRK